MDFTSSSMYSCLWPETQDCLLQLPVDGRPPCAATEMLLPTMFTLGVSSDVTCHREITGISLRGKGVDEIRRCCQQRENDTVTEYCLPAMKNQLRDHYYLDFVDICTASTRCQLSSPGGFVQHTDGEDYVAFTFHCVKKDTVLHIQHDSTHTGQEVYLYNDQHDGMGTANCIAYSHECDSHVIIQLAATRVVSPVCRVTFTDGDVSVQVDCKNPPASSNCSSTMFESKSNYVNMSIFMTVDPGRQEKEFLWIRAKGKNVTVVCGANIPSDVSLNCPTTTTTTTTTTAPTTTTITVTSTSTSTTTTNTVSASISTNNKIPGTSAGSPQNLQPSETTSAETMASHFDNPNSPPGQPNRFPKPTSLTCGESSSTLPVTLGVSAAVLFVGFVLGWIMSRCFYQRKTRKNGADVYTTTSTMKEEHTYSTVQPASTATYANTSYEYYNQ
ncbi:uncharacterized protein LOC124256404 isoform X2 [Haliotis rubra]|uniref:uncharacterized protein LOC124256404 isoform X2 n=1 Tax=Haliotis rubra TaxID=36100 RepID=UPI001EE5441A|nr:uncharacterized protein LOC124256404 isoform X2 [Haliotis rubra]